MFRIIDDPPNPKQLAWEQKNIEKLNYFKVKQTFS